MLYSPSLQAHKNLIFEGVLHILRVSIMHGQLQRGIPAYLHPNISRVRSFPNVLDAITHSCISLNVRTIMLSRVVACSCKRENNEILYNKIQRLPSTGNFRAIDYVIHILGYYPASRIIIVQLLSSGHV